MAYVDNLDVDWDNFCDDECSADANINTNEEICTNKQDESLDFIKPKCSLLYISTKTKICYLNKSIDLKKVFWEIPIIPYHFPQIGVVKKQMKFNSTTIEELNLISMKIKDYEYVDNYVISQIINPEGRIKFKDIRKISIGLCKKDIISYRCKKKSAFYNCFVVIINDTLKVHLLKNAFVQKRPSKELD